MAFPDHRRLVGVISGMIVWAVWFVVVYALTGVGCDAGWQHRSLPGGGNQLSLLMLLSTAVALLLIGWCAWRGYQAWKASRESGRAGLENLQRLRFMGLLMLVLSLLAGIGTLMIAVPILMLEPCAA
jgi:hypothetical protein